MRIETTTRNIYKYDELTPVGKEAARQKFQERDDFPQGQEALESLKKLAGHFGARLAYWEIDWAGASYSFAKFDIDRALHDEAEIKEMLGRLGTFDPETLKGGGDCVLTGVCYDEDAIDGLRRAFLADGVRDIGELLQAGFKTWLKAIQAEYEYQYTNEAFAETCEANGYEFTDKGELI